MFRALPADVQPLSPKELFERILRLSVADGTASERTLDAYRQGLALFLAWCDHPLNAAPEVRKIDPKAATFDDIQLYRKWLAEVKGYKRSTMRLRLQAVKILYTAFQRWGVRADNPAAGVRAPKVGATKTAAVLKKALSPDQARELAIALDEMKRTPLELRDAAICALGLYHGLRPEEIAELRCRDVDWYTLRTLTVVGKGDKERVLLLEQGSAALLRRWLDTIEPTLEGDPQASDEPLFFQLQLLDRKPLSVRSIERAVDSLLHDLGMKIPGRSAHSLRHTYALMACLAGCPDEALAESMGHADIRTTHVYKAAAAQYQQNPAAGVQAMLKPQVPPAIGAAVQLQHLLDKSPFRRTLTEDLREWERAGLIKILPPMQSIAENLCKHTETYEARDGVRCSFCNGLTGAMMSTQRAAELLSTKTPLFDLIQPETPAPAAAKADSNEERTQQCPK